MTPQKSDFYFCIIDSIKKDSRLPSLSISRQSLNYYVSTLKKEDIIRKLGYGTWELTGKKFEPKQVKKQPQKMSKASKAVYKRTTQIFTSSKNIRGHGFIITFKIPKIPGWYKAAEFFKKKNIQYKRIGIRESGLAINFRGYKFHIYKQSIVIYSNNSYFSETAEKAFQYGLYDIIQIFKGFENLIGISLKFNKSYKFKVSRQHYAKINDDLAKLYRGKGQRLEVSTEKGVWLITDNSLNLNELETVHEETAKNDMDGVVQPFFNDLKQYYENTGEKIIPSELLYMIARITQNQAVFDANMASHIKAVQDLSKGVSKFNEKIDILINLHYGK